MKSYGIPFTAEMILATIRGDKSHTRRVIEKIDKYKNVEPGDTLYFKECWRICAWDLNDGDFRFEYKADGFCRSDWVKCKDEFEDGELFERYAIQCSDDAEKANRKYDAEGFYHWKDGEAPTRWRSGMLMPQWAARIRRTVIRTWTERVQDISEEDAKKEGAIKVTDGLYHYCRYSEWNPSKSDDHAGYTTAKAAFKALWGSIYGKRGYGWERNPMVRVLEWRNEND